LKTLFENDKSRAVLLRHINDFQNMEDMEIPEHMSFEEAAANYPQFISKELLMEIDQELAGIK
jgi:hypothetical protein